MDWTARQLRAIVAIAEHRNISHAAAALGLTQPSMSRILARIEAEVDTPLFIRSPDGARPTDAGDRFVETAADVLRMLDDMGDGLRPPDDRLTGRICVAMPDTTGNALFMPLIDHVLTVHPDVDLQVMAHHPNSVPLALLAGDADVGVISSAHRDTGVAGSPFAVEDLFLVGPPSMDMEDTIALKDVVEYPLVLPAIKPGLRDLIDAAFAQEDLRPDVVLQVDAADALVNLITTERGLSIMSFAGIHRLVAEGQLTASRIVEPSIQRELSTAVPGNRPETRLMTAIRQIIAELAFQVADEARWAPQEDADHCS